ncbi:MAG: hypothetical protein R3F54_22965 [Alphaproteobacteria bacterium]
MTGYQTADEDDTRKGPWQVKKTPEGEAIGVAGAAAGALVARRSSPPQVRKKWLTYWNCGQSQSPQDLDRLTLFNASQDFIEVEVDANMAVMDCERSWWSPMPPVPPPMSS